MRKLGAFFVGLIIAFAFVFSFAPIERLTLSNITAKANEALKKEVYVGGMSAGFTLGTGGAQVIGLCEVMTENAVKCPAAEVGIRAGDIIFKANGKTVDSVGALNDILSENQEKSIKISLKRGNEEIDYTLKPVKDKVTDRYKIGVLIRDSVSGIGTVTYIEKDTKRFAALGHSVVGEDKKELKIASGSVYPCSIVGVTKGVRGKAGELRGMFMTENEFGTAQKLCSCGIFGVYNKENKLNNLPLVEADSSQAKIGGAYIYSTVDGISPEKYEIEIVKVDKFTKSNKNYVVKITDERLLEQTGGIVQGMSGSPILQNGKLIGAITHVFLNDPTRGYGIDILQMIEE